MTEGDWTQRTDVWGEPTDWSLVAGASRARSGPTADEVWKSLLERYRHPVKLAVRRRLRDGSLEDDVVDAFFGYLFSGDVLSKADRERGRFRCFLQVVLKRYLSRERRRAFSRRAVPLPDDVPVHETPEIERQQEAEWAAAVLRSAIHALERESPRGAELLLRSHGVAPYTHTSSEALCAEHQINRNALYQAVFRARRRLRELVLDEIRQTVLTEGDFVEEKKLIVQRLLEGYSHVFADAADE